MTLARALKGSYLRVGGDDSDYLIFKNSRDGDEGKCSENEAALHPPHCEMFATGNFEINGLNQEMNT